MHDNLLRLRIIAQGLGDLCEEMVFVGGSVASLYADDAAASDIRPTTDVDCVTEVASYGSYETLERRLRARGFVNDIESGVICRWKYKGQTVDIMPDDARILGFSNPWYSEGYKNKITVNIGLPQRINIFPILYFLASKIEALYARGGTDWRLSHDFEDIIFVLNNNVNIEEIFINESHNSLKTYLKNWATDLLLRPNYVEEIECVLPYGESERLEQINRILQTFSSSPRL